MKLTHLTDDELDLATKRAAHSERASMVEILWHMRENERRMLFAKRAHSDLKTYCVKELKMSEGSAWRRVYAMRVLRELPEVAAKMEEGVLTLMQVCRAQSWFQRLRSPIEEKREILQSIEGKTQFETEMILAKFGPEPDKDSRECRMKGGLEVTMFWRDELLKIMEEIKILVGRKLTHLELVELMTHVTVAKLRQESRRALSRWQRRKSKDVSAADDREVRQRAGHQCQYVSGETGQRCDARLYLQIEHIIPRAQGGTNDLDNLELLCASHNKLRALEAYGREKMKQYMPSLQS